MAYAMSVMRDRIPADTKMFCGHEYTTSNLAFCQLADPTNASIPAKSAEVAALKAVGWASVPTTVTEERSYNVFMRCFDADVQKLAGFEGDAVKTIAFLRAFKNTGKRPTPDEVAKL